MIKDRQKYIWLIPEKVLDALQKIKNEPPPFSGFNFDYLCQILSTISIHLKEDNTGQYWACLNTEILRKLVPYAELYLRFLRKLEIVERDKGYKVGDHSFSYRFTELYKSRFRNLPVTNQKLMLRIKSVQTNLKKRNSKKYPCQNAHLRNMTIKYEEAKKFIDEYPYDNIEKYNYALSSITRIHRGDIYIKVNKTNFRLDSNLTNMPKILRQFVRINGKPIMGVDISNSQPFLLTTVLLCPETIACFYPGSFPLEKIKSLNLSEKEDVKRYVALVTDGGLYKDLWDEFTARGLSYTEDDVKIKVLIILFDMNCHRSKTRKIFEELFPHVGRACQIIRSENYNLFAILLQRIESHLVLGIILRRLNIEYPDMITVTVHDSVYTTSQENQMIVHRVMEEELKKFSGLRPNFKFKY